MLNVAEVMDNESRTGSAKSHRSSEITSGPMSEGRINLNNVDVDSAQNLFMFTTCLLVIGLSFLLIGVYLYLYSHSVAFLALTLIVIGLISFVSASVYLILFGITLCINKHSLNDGNEKVFEEQSKSTDQSQISRDDSGFSGGSPDEDISADLDSLQLNVKNLDIDLDKNLDVQVWNEEHPVENYLHSFGELARIPSPNPVARVESKKKPRKRNLFDSFSLRNSGQQFSIRSNNKSDSQAKLLEEGENTLFSAESLGNYGQRPEVDEGVTLITNTRCDHQVMVHFSNK